MSNEKSETRSDPSPVPDEHPDGVGRRTRHPDFHSEDLPARCADLAEPPHQRRADRLRPHGHRRHRWARWPTDLCRIVAVCDLD